MSINGHILVVEDDSVNAAKIEHQLIKLGYSVAGVVGSGEEAVELAEKSRPDLVLMDIGLDGEMDGIETANLIRQRFAIPVIYLTTNSDEQTLDRARSTEAHGFLLKPILGPVLHSSLQIALQKAEMESRVQEERKWLVTTLRCIRDGVIAADSVGTIKLLNPAAERLTGWCERDALGRDLSDVFQVLEPETRSLADAVVMRVVSGALEGTYSHKLLISRQGVETEVEETAAAITNEAGNMIGVVLVFRKAAAGQTVVSPLGADHAGSGWHCGKR